MKRRHFFGNLGGAAAGLILGRSVFQTHSPEALKNALNRTADEESFWTLIRSQFLFPEDYAYFNTGGIGAVPLSVLHKVKSEMDALEVYPRPGHDHEKWVAVKEKCARFLGAAGSDEIALTGSTTEGLNIILSGLPLKSGDEVITSTHEHAGLEIPLLNLKNRKGIRIKLFEPDLANGLNNVTRIARQMSRKTRLVILSHVTCTTGQLLPVQKIGKLARDRGVWFALDGAQSAGHVPIDLKTLPVDFFATSGHKWMLGPKRTGILFVRRPLLDTLTPTTVGAYSDLSHDIRKQTLTFHPTAQRYEYATQNETLYRGLETAADLLECIGPDRIMERNYRLARTLYDGLSAIHGVALLSPLESAYRTCMITFKFREINYREAAGLLGKERFRVRVVPEGGVEGIRVSIHLYNRKEEVLNLLNAVDRLTG